MALQTAPREDPRLAEALRILGFPNRLTLLRQLRTPKALGEIELQPAEAADEGADYRRLSRQTVRSHLDRLIDIDVVIQRETVRDYGPTTEYVVNHQALFAMAERFRALASLRPTTEPDDVTMEDADAPQAYTFKGPCLVLVKGVDEGLTFSLAPPAGGEHGEWVIGRRRDVSIPLDFDPFVSGENARVTWDGAQYHVQDVGGSRNGTFLNFRRLPDGASRPLSTGDLVGVGRSILMFRG